MIFVDRRSFVELTGVSDYFGTGILASDRDVKCPMCLHMLDVVFFIYLYHFPLFLRTVDLLFVW